jgi:hypothetical protein
MNDLVPTRPISDKKEYQSNANTTLSMKKRAEFDLKSIKVAYATDEEASGKNGRGPTDKNLIARQERKERSQNAESPRDAKPMTQEENVTPRDPRSENQMVAEKIFAQTDQKPKRQPDKDRAGGPDLDLTPAPANQTLSQKSDKASKRMNFQVDGQASGLISCLKRFCGLESRFGSATNEPRDSEDFLELEKRFCSQCNIDQPIRTKHCKHCKGCISTFDHHCIWIGNCIGERNKWLFFVFLFSQIFTLVLSIHSICDDFLYRELKFTTWLSDHAMSMMILVMLVGFLINICV